LVILCGCRLRIRRHGFGSGLRGWRLRRGLRGGRLSGGRLSHGSGLDRSWLCGRWLGRRRARLNGRGLGHGWCRLSRCGLRGGYSSSRYRFALSESKLSKAP
jgi:hypothetical protein